MVAQGLGGHQHVNAGQISEVYSDPQLEYAHNLGLRYPHDGITPGSPGGTGTGSATAGSGTGTTAVWEVGGGGEKIGMKTSGIGGGDNVINLSDSVETPGGGVVVVGEGPGGVRRVRTRNNSSISGAGTFGERESSRTPRTAYSDTVTSGSAQGGGGAGTGWPHAAGRPLYEVPG